VIRTVWLGLSFLVVLAGVSSFRFAFGHFDDAYALGIARSEGDREVGATTVQDTLTNTDRLPALAYVTSGPDTELATADRTPAESLSPAPPAIVTPRIVNRRLQQPASPVVRQARHQNPKRKQAKRETVADKPQVPAEPKACQLEDYDAVRRAFSLPTGCHG
jgi:hypothetical protein